MATLVYKIMTAPQWSLWHEVGATFGSHDDRRDGYIHLSTGAQLLGTLTKHFVQHRLVWLVQVDADGFGPALKWEPSRRGELFPHLYGRLDAWRARAAWPLRVGEDGAWPLPMGVAP